MEGIVGTHSEEAYARLLEGDSDWSSTIPFLGDQVLADQLAAKESWRLMSSKKTDNHLEPFSLPWFLQIERRRYARQGAWIPRLLEFSKHHGERLLAMGDGLGTDWVRYAEHGTEVTVCSSSAEQLLLVRRHFELRTLRGEFVETNGTQLPITSHSMDVVCLSDRSWQREDLEGHFREVYRVLKPGGKVIAIFPGWYNTTYWQNRLMPWKRWFHSPVPTSSEMRFSAQELKPYFRSFGEVRVYKRHLRRADLPHLWRIFPLPFLERVMGRFLIVKAFKPLSAVSAIEIAA